MTLVLPVPPSINAYWKPWRGRMVKTSEGKAYQTLICNTALSQGYRPTTDPLGLRVLWRPTDRRCGDLDNRLKALLDGLQGGVYKNDRQVVAIDAARAPEGVSPTLRWVEIELA